MSMVKTYLSYDNVAIQTAVEFMRWALETYLKQKVCGEKMPI